MLYEVTAQPSIFLCMCAFGFLCGFLFDLKNILQSAIKKDKIRAILSHFFTFFALFLTFSVFFVTNLEINFGEIRLFAILAFAISFAIQRFFVINFLAKPLAKCYNKIKGKMDEKKRARQTAKQQQN